MHGSQGREWPQGHSLTRRTHSSLAGATPVELAGGNPKLQTTLNNFHWKTHCRELYQLPAETYMVIRHAQATVNVLLLDD